MKRRLLVLVAAIVFSGSGCLDFLKPTQTGAQQCATVSALYCNSYSIPQTLQGAPGACCAVGDYAGASVGYLCAYGADRAAAGCFSTLELARQICPTAVSIVRCTR